MWNLVKKYQYLVVENFCFNRKLVMMDVFDLLFSVRGLEFWS